MKKYLLYAIGEILLVVIGILIALQLNTWNGNRLNRIQEVKYLKRMHRDLQTDTTMLARNLSLTQTKANFLLSILNDDLDFFIDTDKSNREIFISRFRGLPTPSKSTIQELTSSGKIGLLQNDELKEKILNYYNLVENRRDALKNPLSDYPRKISELIPGELNYYARSRRASFTKKDKMELLRKLKKNKAKLVPELNAELGYTGLQYSAFKELEESALMLLEALEIELKSKTKS